MQYCSPGRTVAVPTPEPALFARAPCRWAGVRALECRERERANCWSAWSCGQRADTSDPDGIGGRNNWHVYRWLAWSDITSVEPWLIPSYRAGAVVGGVP